MHNVSIGDPLFARLQNHAVPLVDTIEDVISRAIDALERNTPKPPISGAGIASIAPPEAKTFDPGRPPSLKHAVPRKAVVGNQELVKDRYWNSILLEVLRAAARHGASQDQLLTTLEANVRKGRFGGPGFRYVSEADLSVQQLNSDRAWAEAYRIARKFGIAAEVHWVWPNKGDAHIPGGSGVMKFNP